MKYIIRYECRTEGKVFQGNFEFESESQPNMMDFNVVEAAMRASLEFTRSGAAGVEILEISQGA